MKIYKKVLVPLDGSPVSEKIIPEVEKIIDKEQTTIVLLRVAYIHRIAGLNPMEIEAALVREAEEYIADIENSLKKKGYNVEGHVRYGFEADEILKHLEDNPDIQLIAMSTHGRSGVGRWLLGSVAEKVIRHATRPVLMVRPSK